MRSMLTTPLLLLPVLAAATGVAVSGCGGADSISDRPEASTPSNDSPTSQAGAGRSGVTSGSASTQEDQMMIDITIEGQHFQATLDESAAARDLLAQLPVTVDMVDHADVEKTGPLPSPLSLEGQPPGADPDPGDVGYYAPGNDLVFYYGDQSYFPGIVILGRLDGDAAQRIAELDGAVTATVEAG
jgi:hypothetical protein